MIWGFFSARHIVQAAPAAKLQARQSCEAVQGFALVDVLVGLTIMGVLSALMISFLGQAKSVKRFSSDAQIQTELEAVADYLENAIAAAEPIPLSGGTPDRRDFVLGDGSSVRMSAVRPIGFETAALQEVVISTSPATPGDSRLEILTRPRFGFAEAEVSTEPVVLQASVVAFELEYLQIEDGKPAWIDIWDRPGNLPSAIRFQISVRRAGKTYQATGLAILALAKDIAARHQQF